MEKEKQILLTGEEKKLIYNAMIQIIEWQNESFSKRQLKVAEKIIKKIV